MAVGPGTGMGGGIGGGIGRGFGRGFGEDNIRVNCIAPGAIATEGLNVYPDGVPERFANTNPMKRMGDVHDITTRIMVCLHGEETPA